MKKIIITKTIEDSYDSDEVQRMLHADSCYNIFHKLVNPSPDEKELMYEIFRTHMGWAKTKPYNEDVPLAVSFIILQFMEDHGVTLEHFR